MRASPRSSQALEKINRDSVTNLVIVPLYPQFSVSTSGSSLRLLQSYLTSPTPLLPPTIKHTVIDSWYDRPGYVSSVSSLTLSSLDSLPPGPDRHVLFSAHGVPKSYIQAGDPYQSQVEDCVRLIAHTLPPDVTVHLSYQSRVGPIQWLTPYTDDVIPRLGSSGVKSLVVVPISFVSEHIETLEEIDIEYKSLALASGVTNWRRVPALNTSPAFIADLADMVRDALDEPAVSVTSACVRNNCVDEGETTVDDMMGINGMKDDRLGNAEKVNGRLAMLGVVGTVLWEVGSGKGVFSYFFGTG